MLTREDVSGRLKGPQTSSIRARGFFLLASTENGIPLLVGRIVAGLSAEAAIYCCIA